MEVSIIVATYNRLELLRRLLTQLDAQTFNPAAFEVVVVDDGSRDDIPAALRADTHRYALKVLRQENAGPAAARHRAIENATGRVLVIVDDDMQVLPTFVAEHVAMHPYDVRRAVLGRLAPDPQIDEMPYFERWYAAGHERTARRARAGTLHLDGYAFYTGNVSLRRADYLDVGGFDLQLRIAEDTDLGLRLEKRGVEIAYCEKAVAYHGSDHVSEDKWLAKARAYGVNFHQLGRRHHDVSHANALRYLFEMNPLARPFLALSLAMPKLTRHVSDAVLGLSQKLWAHGLDGPAAQATSVGYTMEYMRGVRSQTGTLPRTAWAVLDHWWQRVKGQAP